MYGLITSMNINNLNWIGERKILFDKKQDTILKADFGEVKTVLLNAKKNAFR